MSAKAGVRIWRFLFCKGSACVSGQTKKCQSGQAKLQFVVGSGKNKNTEGWGCCVGKWVRLLLGLSLSVDVCTGFVRVATNTPIIATI